MSLKLSYRDKVIFIVVLCLIVLIVGAIVIVRPEIDTMNVAELELDNKKAELQRLENRITTLPDLVDNLKKTAEEIGEIQEVFYVEAEPYIMEQIVTDMLSERRIDVTGITTQYAAASQIRKYQVFPSYALAYDMKMNADLYEELDPYIYMVYNGIDPVIAPDVVIGVTMMTFAFEAAIGHEELINCLDVLAADEQTLLVATFSGSSTFAGNLGSGDEPVSENSVYIYIFSIVPLNVDKVIEDSDGILRELGMD